MAKFDNLLRAFWHIRDNPLDYLPEKSLTLFASFWFGYSWRYENESEDSPIFCLPAKFFEFIYDKYKIDSSHNTFNVISLYSRNEAEAFDNWFGHLSEFVAANNLREVDFYSQSVVARQTTDFFEFLKAILKRPAMYVGTNSFKQVASFLAGHLRVIEDFELNERKQETIFREFQKYIELKDVNLPAPSWDKIIWFWSQSETSSLEMFGKYIDEFAFQEKGFIESIEYHWQRRLKSGTS